MSAELTAADPERQKESGDGSRRTEGRPQRASVPPSIALVLQLQRTAGNTATTALLQQLQGRPRARTPSPAEPLEARNSQLFTRGSAEPECQRWGAGQLDSPIA